MSCAYRANASSVGDARPRLVKESFGLDVFEAFRPEIILQAFDCIGGRFGPLERGDGDDIQLCEAGEILRVDDLDVRDGGTDQIARKLLAHRFEAFQRVAGRSVSIGMDVGIDTGGSQFQQ